MYFDLRRLELGDVVGIVRDDDSTISLTIVRIPLDGVALSDDQLVGKRMSGRRYRFLGQIPEAGGFSDPSVIALGVHLFEAADRTLMIIVRHLWVLDHDAPRPDKDAKEKRGKQIF